VYEDLYCAHGNGENAIKAMKNALHSDRTSATTFLANATRLLVACGASVLHHALRTHTLTHTALATAQPSTVILTLCKVAGIRLRRDNWVSVRYPDRRNAAKSSVILQRTDRQGILGQKPGHCHMPS
jgi:Transposase DDE domain group 1